jgi:hypothetical protein
MMNKKSLLFVLTLIVLMWNKLSAQGVPTANFTLSPNPICSNARVFIQDLSTGNPTAWSYTIAGGFGAPTVLTVQNPTFTFNFQGTYIISLIASNVSGNSTIVTKTITVLAGPNANVNPQNLNICLGSTVQANITVTGGGGPFGGGVNTFSWSTGSTASVIAVSPTATTIYSCVITATNGCSIERTSTVNVFPATVTITSSPANICPGTTSTLQVSGSGPGPWTYTWSNSSNTNTMTSNFPTVVSATIQNNNGCKAIGTYSLGSSTTLSLTTVSNPSATCIGGNATISAVGATSYSWSVGTSTAGAIAVNPSSTTIYTVFGFAGTCTGSATYTLQVSTNPTVTISSNTNATCPGGTVSLTANGATNYTWTPGNFYTSNIVITPTVSGNVIYTARGINPGCPARTTTIGITVGVLPNVSAFSSASVICLGESIAISAVGANSYTWSTGSNQAVIINSPTTTTTFTVKGANTSNCSRTVSVTITVNECTGLIEDKSIQNKISIYPNPSQGTIHFKGDYDGELLLLNNLGQAINIFKITKSTQEVSYNGLAEGIYFLMSEDKQIMQKIIVTK